MRPLSRKVPFGPTLLIPGGCFHYPVGDQTLLRKWVARVKETGALTILMGDSLDGCRSTYRDFLRSYTGDENSQGDLDLLKQEQVKKLADILFPIREQILGAILGNHRWEASDGVNSEQLLCHYLSIPYLGPMSFFRLDFYDGQKRRDSVTIWAHHDGGSKAGGRTAAADVAALKRATEGFQADIYLLGHTHQRNYTHEVDLGITPEREPKLVEKHTVRARTGAFLQGIKEEGELPVLNRHQPSYAEKQAYRPVSLGWLEMEIRFSQDGEGNRRHSFSVRS